jgi:hypothetical protein
MILNFFEMFQPNLDSANEQLTRQPCRCKGGSILQGVRMFMTFSSILVASCLLCRALYLSQLEMAAADYATILQAHGIPQICH